MENGRIAEVAQRVLQRLRERGHTLALAESCTGGWVAKSLTDFPGSSDVFVAGWVCYSDYAKISQLGVPGQILAEHGAVSEPVVEALAKGALERGDADLAVAISGIAGPGGGTAEKPVGTVCFAWSTRASTRTATARFDGDRDSVRRASVIFALEGLLAD